MNRKLDTMHRVTLEDAGEIEMYEMADDRVRMTVKKPGFDQLALNIHKSQLNKLALYINEACLFFQERNR
jgi:hypothetical protein